jgi:hypothetical protein
MSGLLCFLPPQILGEGFEEAGIFSEIPSKARDTYRRYNLLVNRAVAFFTRIAILEGHVERWLTAQ